MVKQLEISRLDNTTIKVILPNVEDGTSIELRFESHRNRHISKFSDRSAKHPTQGPFRQSRPKTKGKEIWFPVIDVELEPGMEAVAEFENVAEGDAYCWNGHLAPGMRPLSGRVVLRDQLEHWENGLYVESPSATLQRFYLRKPLAPVEGAAPRPGQIAVRFLPQDWQGTITAYAIDGTASRLLAQAEIVSPKLGDAETFTADLSRPQLMHALTATIRYILRCQNRNPLSPTYGGLYLFYDLDAATYRRPDWMWTWGPAIKLLVDAAQISEIAQEIGAEQMLRVAREVGEASLRFQCLDPQHPAYGLVLCRYDPRPQFPDGYAGFLSPADSLFLAGWGWIPLYEATGDRRYLDAANLLVEQMARILSLDAVVEQDYITKIERWKNWTMDESGFGVEGFAELYRITRNERHRAIGKAYIDNLLDTFQRSDGLWDRVWHRNDPDRESMGWRVDAPPGTPVLVPTHRMTRGQGWAMIGLLAAHRMSKAQTYLELANQMAAHLVDAQHDSGYWAFCFDQPVGRVGISEKGTTLWSLLFYRLYHQRGDKRHLAVARKALLWGIAAQYVADDPNAAGGIVGISPASGVVYRRWFPLICTYTMAWHGLALLAELDLDKAQSWLTDRLS